MLHPCQLSNDYCVSKYSVKTLTGYNMYHIKMAQFECYQEFTGHLYGLHELLLGYQKEW